MNFYCSDDCHSITLKEIQWFSVIRSEFFKDWKRRVWRKEKIPVKYRLCEFQLSSNWF